MKTYHKINGLFKRDEKGKFTKEYATPEFEYLKDNIWVGTEKVDGTNIRLIWDGDKVNIKGKTDNAQLPTFLYDKLLSIVENAPFAKYFSESNEVITLYGEGYGKKINKGHNYIPDGVDFILFDVKIGSWWMTRNTVDEIGAALGIKTVDVVFEGTLNEAIDIVAEGMTSNIANTQSEGLILVPKMSLFSRNGDRIITKLKTKDFR